MSLHSPEFQERLKAASRAAAELDAEATSRRLADETAVSTMLNAKRQAAAAAREARDEANQAHRIEMEQALPLPPKSVRLQHVQAYPVICI